YFCISFCCGSDCSAATLSKQSANAAEYVAPTPSAPFRNLVRPNRRIWPAISLFGAITVACAGRLKQAVVPGRVLARIGPSKYAPIFVWHFILQSLEAKLHNAR